MAPAMEVGAAVRAWARARVISLMEDHRPRRVAAQEWSFDEDRAAFPAEARSIQALTLRKDVLLQLTMTVVSH